jgi:hypothetical protein
VFSQPEPPTAPTSFKVHHASDGAAYKAIDELNKEHKHVALPFPAPRGGVEPTLTLEQVLGNNPAAAKAVQRITGSGSRRMTMEGGGAPT